MSVSEAEVGIVAFTDTLPGFTAVLKHTWHDFHVNEVGLDGNVIHLTSLKLPSLIRDKEKETAVQITESDDNVAEIISQFRELVGEADAEKLRVLAFSEASKGIESIEVGPIDDKQKRTEVHMFFKRELLGFPTLATESAKKPETEETYIRIAPLSKAKKMRDWKNRKREHKRIRNERGESCRYVHFVLYKENTDNQMAINIIAKELHIPPRVFRLAGTKDKRGVTTQLVAGQNVDINALSKLNARLKHIKVGNFTPTKENLYVGDLLGNQFQIVLRDLQESSPEQVCASCESLKTNGFVNYFGLQRFGQGIPTHAVGRALLKGDWKGAAQLILEPCQSDDAPTAEAKKRYLAGYIDGALEVLPRYAFSERALLQGYSEEGPEQHLPSLNKIGRNTRTLYAHAYQSYVWNRAVSERIARFGPHKVLVGDLVLLEEPNTGRKTSTNRIASVKHLTDEDIASNKYSITDVVLPLPGGSIMYPNNEMEQIYHDIAKEDNVSLTKSVHKVKEFSIEKLTGDYRKMIVNVERLEYDILSYSDSLQPLIQSDLEIMQESEEAAKDVEANTASRKRSLGSGEESKSKRVKREGDAEKMALKLCFQLPASSYATMVVRQLTKQSTSKSDQILISNTQADKPKSCSQNM